MSRNLQIGDKVMSVFAECEGPHYLYKGARDRSICLDLVFKPYQICTVLDRLKTSRRTVIKVKTPSGIEGWIHTSCLKRV